MTLLLGVSNTRIQFNASNVAKFVVVYQKLNAFSNESFVNHPSSPPVVLLVLPAAPSSSRRSKSHRYVFAVIEDVEREQRPDTEKEKTGREFVSSIVVVVIAVASSSGVVVVVVAIV